MHLRLTAELLQQSLHFVHCMASIGLRELRGVADLKPVHTGEYSPRFRREFVAENSGCRRKRRLSQKSATVAEFGDSRRCLAVFGDNRRFRRQWHFLRQCGQGFNNKRRKTPSHMYETRQSESHTLAAYPSTLAAPRYVVTVDYSESTCIGYTQAGHWYS